jgi:hypothetical protein
VWLIRKSIHPSGGCKMVNDDLVKCPLCGGFTHVQNHELLTALRDARIRQQVENFAAELLHGQGELAGVTADKPQGKNFQNDVHTWNPNVPVWKRSQKE